MSEPLTVISLDFLFMIFLFIVIICGTIHIGTQEELPAIKLFVFIFGTCSISLLYAWIMGYPMWPFF